ncbi:MAG: nucleotidyltransferase domain-containing protein [Candidatus Scalinduaceae bacterium]
MINMDFSNTTLQVKERMEPFFNEILSSFGNHVKSIYIIGSAVTNDFDEKTSDVDSLIVLKEKNLDIFDFIAPIGKKYGKKKIRAPIIMTNDYIRSSLEVFPIQFLNIKIINKLIYGEDVLKDITIDKSDLRLVCERELKGWIQNLGQAYIKSLGNDRIIRELFKSFLSSYIPIFRAILFLHDRELPQERNIVLDELEKAMKIRVDVFRELVNIKTGKYKPTHGDLTRDFRDLYNTLDDIANKIDKFEV